MTLDDRGRDGGTTFILRIKEQETRLTLLVHDTDDDDDDDDDDSSRSYSGEGMELVLRFTTPPSLIGA